VWACVRVALRRVLGSGPHSVMATDRSRAIADDYVPGAKIVVRVFHSLI
jgi:hypothetical protein